MYSQPEMILEQYDVTVNAVTKGRGIYLCDTDKGRKILMPFRGSKERAAFVRELLEFLGEQGLSAEQILVTKEGEVLASDEAGEKYLLKDMVRGEECSTKHPEQMTFAVEAIAAAGRCMEGCPLAIPEFMGTENSSLLELYERHYRELVKVKNYVKSRKSKNEFELKFQAVYPHFTKQAQTSLEMLGECEKSGVAKSLCHGDVNQHNIICTGQVWQLVNYEHAACSHPISDLSNFLRKMMEKNNWNRELGMRLIDAYDRIRPIGEEGYRYLYMLLLFPEKFWKLANHYLGSHKAWVSGRDIEKLDRIMAQEGRREEFLENLFSNIA